jgi:large subunit ribosomal protein L25
LKTLLLNQKLAIKSMEAKLQAEKRTKNEKLSPDFSPAVLYGKGVENQSLKIKRVDFEKAFAIAGESNLINLDFGQGVVKILVKDLQRDVLKYTFSHVDLYQVNMKEKITTEIPLHFVGESKAVKELGGMLMKSINELEVECLPSDLVDHVDVNISVLNTYDDVIKISDLVLPVGFKLLHHNPEDVIAMVVEPKVEVEEVKPVEAAPVVEEKKEEDKKE